MTQKNKYSKRYVSLNSPKNKRYLILLLAIAVFLGVLVTSNMWLPDGRSIVNTNIAGKSFQFSSSEIIVERVAYNPSNLVGEVRIKETVHNSIWKKPLEYKVTNDKGQELPSKVIRSDFIALSKDKKLGTEWTIIQFAIDPSYYYFTLAVSESDYGDRGITFDYRNVNHIELIEKGADYLKNMPTLFIETDALRTEVETLERKLTDIEPEINKAQSEVELADEATKPSKETAHQELLNERTEYELQLDEKEKALVNHEAKLLEWESQ